MRSITLMPNVRSRLFTCVGEQFVVEDDQVRFMLPADGLDLSQFPFPHEERGVCLCPSLTDAADHWCPCGVRKTGQLSQRILSNALGDAAAGELDKDSPFGPNLGHPLSLRLV